VIRLSQSCETERFSADVYLQQKKACSTLDRLENRKLWNPPHSNDYSGRNLVWSQPAGFTPEDLLGEVGETRPFAQHEITTFFFSRFKLHLDYMTMTVSCTSVTL
jgi:hypothetical protein